MLSKIDGKYLEKIPESKNTNYERDSIGSRPLIH